MPSWIRLLGQVLHHRKPHAQRPLALEALEDRCVPSAANQHFVENIYQALLNRPADHSGLTTWTAALDNGVSRTLVVQQIEQNDEYKGKLIGGLYAKLLNRALDPSGLKTWTAFLDAGHNTNELEARILGSGEYFAGRGGNTNAGWLKAVYNDVLGRPLDSAGAQEWSLMIIQGFPRNKIAAAILANAEALQDEVRTLYSQFLQRPADASGLAHFTSELQHGATNEQVRAEILGSDEYFARF
jgi:hypothetical protein